MKTELTTFAFGEQLIRSVYHPDGPRFVAKDVCAALMISNISQAIHGQAARENDGLEEDEKGIIIVYTLGGPQEMLTVTESGLYALVFKSRKKEARAFRKWVTSEVLPAIRRNGSYSTSHHTYLGLIADQIRLGVSPDLAARGAMKLCPQLPANVIDRPASPAKSLITDAEVDSLLTLMQPDLAYTAVQLADAMPRGHRLRSGTPAAKRSSVGKIMERAVASGRAIRNLARGKDRTITYQLPAIATFSTVQS